MIQEPGPSLSLLVSRPAWDALPKDDQATFATAAERAASTMQRHDDAKTPPALRQRSALGAPPDGSPAPGARQRASLPGRRADLVASRGILSP